MNRQLALAGAVVAMLVAAGCLGSLGGSSDLQVTDIDGDWTEAGTLAVGVTVSNLGSAEGSGTVFVEVRIRDGDTYTARREVTLPAGSSETVEVTFEPPAEVVGSGFDANARME